MWVPKLIFTITTVEYAIFSLSQKLWSTTLYTFKQVIKECFAVFPTLYWLSCLGASPLREAFMSVAKDFASTQAVLYTLVFLRPLSVTESQSLALAFI